MRKTTTLLIIFFSLLVFGNTGFSQSKTGCNAELSVEKNRSVKSVGENGTFFTLELKNTSSTSRTYSITSSKTKESCKKSNYNMSKSTNTIPDLNVAIQLPDNLNSNLQDVSVTLSGGSSQKFYVKVEVPEGTTYNIWSCLKVSAKSENCSSNVAETILSVYIPNPSEE